MLRSSPQDEARRSAALQNYQILNSEREALFDDFTRLAAAFCETPISVLVFVDRDRLWFKSVHGLAGNETARDASFCGEAIRHDSVFEVEDATADPRFAEHSFVTGTLGARFYAGAALCTSEGVAVGTLCVIDRKPRKLTEAMRDALGTMARQVVAQLELRRVNRALEHKQRAMLQSHKMAALGHMAAGIAHEVNNPLAIIQGKAELLSHLAQKGAIEAEKVESTSKTIQTTVSRIVKVIRGLRVFSGSSDQDPFTIARARDIVEDTLELCRERFRHMNISLTVGKFSDDLGLQCRPNQISQVLLNLLNNSYDHVREQADRWVRIEVVDLGEHVEFSVTDSGQGLPEIVRDQVFEPFFTTKDVGKGIGLGLSISQGMVEEHGGVIRIDSFHRNTRFVFQIPKQRRKKPSAVQAPV